MLSLVLVLLAGTLLFFAGLGRLPLIEHDEGRNAEVGREMLVSGDWITPHFNGLAYLDKPVVFFWMVAASLKALGVSETAARLPSALMGLATMLLVWWLGRRMFGPAVGLRAALVFGVSPLALVLARTVIFDMTFAFFMTLATAAFWLGEEKEFRQPWLDIVMFAAMGVAVITKGFAGLLVPVGTALVYAVVCGRWRHWLRLRWGWGVAVFLAVSLPWFIAVSLRHPDFPRYALWDESVIRFTTGSARRGGGIFYYVPVFFGGFFPWSFFLLLAGWNRVRRWRELKQEARRPVLFLVVWGAWVFCFFTVSHSKLATYFLPAVVPLSLLMGMVWEDVGKEAQTRPPDWLTAGFALLLGGGVLLAAASHSWLYTSLQVHLRRKIPADSWGLVQPSLLYTGIILAALGFLGRRLASKARGRTAAIASFALAAVIVPTLVLRWYVPLDLYAQDHSSRRLAVTILANPERDAPIYGFYYFRSSLPFYLRRPVGLVSVGWGEMNSNYQVAYQEKARSAGTENPGKGILVTAKEFRALAQSNQQPVLVLLPNNAVEGLWETVGRVEPLWSVADYSVWEIPPAAARPPDNTPAQVVSPFHP